MTQTTEQQINDAAKEISKALDNNFDILIKKKEEGSLKIQKVSYKKIEKN